MMRFFITLSISLFAISSLAAQQIYTLRQTLQQTKAANQFLQVQALNTDLARADAITAGLRANPTLNNQTMLQVSPNHLPTDVGYLSRQNRQFWLQLTKEFDIYHKRDFRLRFSESMTKLTEKSVAETTRNVLYEAATRWVETWYAQINLDLLQKTQVNLDSLVLLNRIRLRNEIMTTTDLTRTELLVEQNILRTQTARQTYAKRLAEFKLLLNVQDSVVVDMNDPLVVPLRVDSLLQFSLNQRADVQVAQNSIDVARRNVDLQKILAKPTNEAGVIWNPQNAVPYVGVYATIELPFYNRNQGEIQKSKVLQEQATRQLAVVEKQVSTEVQTALQTFQINQQRVQRYERILRQSDEVLRTVRYAYIKGATTLVDFLEAQRMWFDTQQAHHDTLYEYRKSYVDVLFVTGLISQW